MLSSGPITKKLSWLIVTEHVLEVSIYASEDGILTLIHWPTCIQLTGVGHFSRVRITIMLVYWIFSMSITLSIMRSLFSKHHECLGTMWVPPLFPLATCLTMLYKVHMTIAGDSVLDVVQHFVERWNEIKRRKVSLIYSSSELFLIYSTV